MANEKMPELKLNNYRSHYLECLNSWKDSLQPCEISESELCLILSNVSKLDYDSYVEVTDMIRTEEIKTITKSGTITDFQVFFKQPSDNNGVITFNKKEVDVEIEAVEFAEWTYKNHWVLNQRSMSWYIELPSGVIDLSTGKTSIELYQIFKNQK